MLLENYLRKYCIISSVINTVAQQDTATFIRLKPIYAVIIPTIRASIPETGDCVAFIIAGKVITARVT